MGDETDDAAKTPTEVVSVGNGVDDIIDMYEDDMEEEADEVVEDVVEDEMVNDASSAAGVLVANEKIIPENVAPPAPRESAAIVGHGNSNIPLLSETRRGLSGEQAEANELGLPRSHVERDDGAVAASSVKLVDVAEGVNIASSGELLELNAPPVTDASVVNGNLFASIHDLFPMNPDLMVSTKYTDVGDTSVHVEQLMLATIDASFAAAAPSVESG
jgi:hypothetical protein